MAEHKIQHFLPQTYLKGFSKKEKSPIGDKIDVLNIYDFKKQTLKGRQTNKIAWKPYYYSFKDENGELDHSMEKKFSELEDFTKRIFSIIDDDISKIIENKHSEIKKIMPIDKDLLITFVFMMLKRVPKQLEEIQNGLKKIAIDIKEKYPEAIISDEEIKKRTILVMHELGLSNEFNILEKLKSKNILFAYIHNDKTSFLTTDNPVVFWRKEGPPGIGYDDTEIRFPINKRCLLVLHGIGEKIEITQFSNRKRIYEWNLYMAKYAKDLIIARDSDLVRAICKDLNLNIVN